MRILIIEDEVHLAEALAQILRKNNYTVDVASDGGDGLDHGLSGIHDLILLDIMLPVMDGISVLKQLRQQGVSTPVILLTAKGEISDKVIGLDSGADDYLPKPFATEELLARIRSASRRKGEVPLDSTIRYGDLELNPTTLKLTRAEREIKLILKECELLALLLNRKTAVTSKEIIIEKLWGYDTNVEYNNVEVYISFLRKKLTYLESNVSITTVRGVGYMLEVNS